MNFHRLAPPTWRTTPYTTGEAKADNGFSASYWTAKGFVGLYEEEKPEPTIREYFLEYLIRCGLSKIQANDLIYSLKSSNNFRHLWLPEPVSSKQPHQLENVLADLRQISGLPLEPLTAPANETRSRKVVFED